MKDFSTNSKKSRKTHKGKSAKEQSLKTYAAVFLTIVLAIALFGGFFKAFSLGKFLKDTRAGSGSSFAAVLSTAPPSVFIFNKENKSVLLLKLEDSVFFTDNGELVKTSSAFGNRQGQKSADFITKMIGINVGNYFVFNKELELSEENLKKNFEEITSASFGLAILVKGGGGSIAETNLTRIALFRLWWQLKDVRVNDVDLVSISEFSEVMKSGRKNISILDGSALHIKLDPLVWEQEIAEADINLEMENRSGVGQAGDLAEEIAGSSGFNVIRVVPGASQQEGCQVMGGKENSKAVAYLAKIFDCDIVGKPNEAFSKVDLVIGTNFAKRYF